MTPHGRQRAARAGALSTGPRAGQLLLPLEAVPALLDDEPDDPDEGEEEDDEDPEPESDEDEPEEEDDEDPEEDFAASRESLR